MFLIHWFLSLTCGCLLSDFVTSASCVPDAQMQNNLRHASRRTQRTADRDEDFLFLVEYPVRVISVAVV